MDNTPSDISLPEKCRSNANLYLRNLSQPFEYFASSLGQSLHNIDQCDSSKVDTDEFLKRVSIILYITMSKRIKSRFVFIK